MWVVSTSANMRVTATGTLFIMWYLAVSTKQLAPFHEGIKVSLIYRRILLVKVCPQAGRAAKGFRVHILTCTHNKVVSVKKTCLYSDLQVSDEEVPQFRDYMYGNWAAAEQWRNLSRYEFSCLPWSLTVFTKSTQDWGNDILQIHDYSIKASITFMAAFQPLTLK